MRRLLFIGIFALLISLGTGQTLAHDDSVDPWQIAGISCAPSSQTIEGQLHVTAGGKVQFATDKAGTISLFCPISREFKADAGSSLFIETHLQVEGGTPGARISVNLRRVRKADGKISDHPQGQINSNSSADCPLTTSWKRCFTRSSTSMSFDEYYYFFQVSLIRQNANQVLSFGGVALGVAGN